MAEDTSFEGYMPLSKLLDFLNEQFDQKGDVWVLVKGSIQNENSAVILPDGTAEMEG